MEQKKPELIGTHPEETYPDKSRATVQITQIETGEKTHIGQQRLRGQDDVTPTARFVERLWIWEICTLLIALLGLASAVVLLQNRDGKRYIEWRLYRFTLTINSFISIFSTIVQSTMLVSVIAALGELKWIWFTREDRLLTDTEVFDNAARGPLGAASMLWALKGRSVACIGAIVVLSTTLLNFSFQSLVTYRPQLDVIDSQAEAVRAIEYTSYSSSGGVAFQHATVAMRVSILSGIYSENPSLNRPQCVSGNCTWPIYTSLGICAKCYDTSKYITRSCGSATVSAEDQLGNTTYGTFPYCNYTLPSGQSIPGYIDPGWTKVEIDVSPNFASNETYFGNSLRSHIAGFSAMQGTWVDGQLNADVLPSFYNLTGVNATECGLDVCVIQYNTSVVNSTLTETRVKTYTNLTDYISEDDSESPRDFVITVPSDGFVYNMSGDAWAGLKRQFSQWSDQDNGALFYGNATTFFEGSHPSTVPDVIAWLQNQTDAQWPTLMANLATSMTTEIRKHPGDISQTASQSAAIFGQTLLPIPHLHVRWVWILVPALLLVLSAIFLAATIYETGSSNANMLWKASSVAAFYHPLTKDGRDKISRARSAKHAEHIARTMKVKWTELGDGGGRLVPVAD